MKLKRLLYALLALVMVGSSLNGILPVGAIDGDGPTVRNDPNGPTVMDDGVILHKTARAVPGYANEWEVTLKIEAPPVIATSDTVIVIDRSNSMTNTMLANAKAAATSLAEELLPEGNSVNRVAVITFGTDVRDKTNGFSTSFSTVNHSINDNTDGIQPQGGGTFTQGAIHAAAELLADSTATYKNVILLSDGVPSYSYGVRNIDSSTDFEVGHTMIGGNDARQFKIMTTNTKFNYFSQVGDGSRSIYEPEGREMWDYYGRVQIGGRRYDGYYNHGNSAIAEANFFKASGGVLHTIAYSAGDLGNDVLNQMASEGKSHTSTGDDLEEIFNDIAGEISSLLNQTHVHDVMGEGVFVDDISHAESLDWDPDFTYNSETGMYEATKTYRVSANEHMLDAESTDGFHPLNKNATIEYNGKVGYFPVPLAKPFYINVTKELVGQEAAGQKFDFEFVHPDGEKTNYQVEAGETHRIMERFPVGSYGINETGTSNNDVAFENYLIDYNVANSRGASFQINEQHADHIDVTITNTYETVDLEVSKVWDDDNDRDGYRDDYSDLAIAVKDGDTYVAYEQLASENQDYTFTDLPKNRNGQEINYEIVEARGCSGSSTITCRSDFVSDNHYTMTIENGVITNKHEPDTVTLTIKKKWNTKAGTLPTVTPELVTVEVTNDKNDIVETVTLQGEEYAEWTGSFQGLKFEDGQEINYSVVEKKIGENTLSAGESTLYIYNDEVLEGKWDASYDGFEVTNTWTPASTVYTGVGEFNIKKLDQDDEPLAGVTFTVGNETYTTDSDGLAKVEFSESNAEPEDEYVLEISETDAPDYYEIIDGTEVLKATTNLELSVDEESLTNTYTKSFAFTVTEAADGYVWQDSTNTLLVSDRALADKLEITKSFEGISADAFANNSEIEFTITGPDGFEEMTIGIGDDECGMSNGKLVCVVDGDSVMLPIGEYTITENNADIANFTYSSEPASKEIKKTVGLGETAEFEFKNTYEPVKTASFKVKKIWEDDDNRDGLRPDDLEVTLLADGEAYGEPVKLTSGDSWEYEWTELPLVNEDAEEIEYGAEEEDLGDDYSSDGGVDVDGVFTFTNTHEPAKYNESGELTVKKLWTGKGNELARPGSVSVELLADGEVIETASILAGQNNEWTHTFTDLYKYAAGEEIVYSVQESAIGDLSFGENESVIVVYTDERTIAGSWTKSVNEFEITNTWQEASDEIIYDGAEKFEIIKNNEDGEALPGVVFAIGNTEKTTDDEGKIVMDVPISQDLKEQTIEYEISESETLEGYELVDGSATIVVSCTSELSETDDEALVNRYTKTCAFEKDGDEVFVWDEEALTLTVVNLRSLANSFTIVKEFSGIDAAKLSGLTFTISGPEDFGENGEMELSFSDDCIVDGERAICEVDGRIPTGEYTVIENNAEIDNYTLTVTGDGETQTIEKDADVVFEIKNSYEIIDPCADGDCGKIEPPVSPDTGEFTTTRSYARESAINYAIGGMAIMMLAGMGLVVPLAKRRQERTAQK